MYKIPCNYSEIFKDRVLIITGVGRSGTTILGKVLGSMKPTYYLFEPAIFKYMAHPLSWGLIVQGHHCDGINSGPVYISWKETFLGTLFEDYFLPIIQGRNTHLNKEDWTYWEDYWGANQNRRWFAWKHLKRRQDAIEYIEKENPLYIIKMPEFQPYMEVAKETFSGVRFIHIIRNGFDVVGSSIERGWYTDEYMNSQMIDWIFNYDEYNVPWWIDSHSQANWPRWNQVTRSACVWRCLTEKGGIEKNDDTFVVGKQWNIRYEDFCADPEKYATWNYPALEKTPITDRHIEDILNYKGDNDPEVTLDDIQEPERSKFKELMERLGYGTNP